MPHLSFIHLQDDIDAGFVFSEAALEAWTPYPNTEQVQASETKSTTLPRLPRISVEKSLRTMTVAGGVDPAYSDAGDTATFDISITNIGNTRLNQVVLTDDMLGDSITCDHDFSAIADGFLPSSHAEGFSITCEATKHLTPDDVDAGFISGAAEVSGSTIETPKLRHPRPVKEIQFQLLTRLDLHSVFSNVLGICF